MEARPSQNGGHEVTAIEERAELKRIAAEAIAELNGLKAAVAACTLRIDKVINHLLSDADSLALAAADERSEGVTVRKIKTTPAEVVVIDTLTGAGKLIIQKITEASTPTLAPGKRACSLCREPGHRATNCPNAHKIQAARKAEVATRPVKKSRGPVSPERKAQLAAALVKARAARKGSK
jgi:hypothetical protein